jgi:mannose-6-phosphate isomerase-like protein (cupin superfamily)
MNFHVALEAAKEQLAGESAKVYTQLMKHGTMQLEYFAPQVEDTQTPHLQDELYIIVSGSSDFMLEDKVISCAAGDALFVPAGMEHRFIHFTADFATWVVFYGKQGGE